MFSGGYGQESMQMVFWAIGVFLLALFLYGLLVRRKWAPVLAQEMKKWEGKSWQQLVSELADVQAYELEFEGKQYQVEVELLEDTGEYLHVIVAVDDGSLPASLCPLSETFLCRKDG